jgi:hypothetical protein
VVEGLLGFWMSEADTSGERITAGVIMAFIFIAVLIAVLRLATTTSGLAPRGLEGQVNPAGSVAEPGEFEDPAPQMIASPNGSYTIEKPPESWSVRELRVNEWVAERMGITDSSAAEIFTEDESESVLYFKSGNDVSLVPIPGVTRLNGRKFPTALESILPTALSIIKAPKVQPPLFVEHSLEHNTVAFISMMLQGGLLQLDAFESVVTGTGQKYLMAEMSQKVENGIVDGQEGKDFTGYFTVIGIEGDLEDHLLFLNYPSKSDDIDALRTLVSSFRPLKPIDVERKRKEHLEKADQAFTELIAERGDELFGKEFAILALRLEGLDLDDPNQRLKAINMVKPFEAFATAINVHDKDMDRLWRSLHEAERGDATLFKDVVAELLSEIYEEDDTEEEEKESPADNEDEDGPQ